MGHWMFFTNHLHVLALLAERPDVRLREVAREVGITERASHRIITELADDGYVTRRRIGSRNRYEVDRSTPLRHPLQSEMTVGEFLELLQGEAIPGRPAPASPSPKPEQTDHRVALLAEAEDRFRCLFDLAPIGMALVSAEGRFLKVNRALCRLVGYPETSLLRTCFQDLTHPDDLDSDVRLAAELLAGRRASYQMDKRYRHAAGHVIWARLSVSLVRDTAGEPLYFVSQIEAARRVQPVAEEPVQPPRRLQSTGARSITGA
jgi:PAS domain S-box-containing protein